MTARSGKPQPADASQSRVQPQDLACTRCVASKWSLVQIDCVARQHLDSWFSVFIPQIALAIRVLTSSIGVRVRGFFGFVLGGLSGRVPFEGSSDVQLVVCMGEIG